MSWRDAINDSLDPLQRFAQGNERETPYRSRYSAPPRSYETPVASHNPRWSHQSEGSVGQAPDSFGKFHGFALASWGWRVAAGLVDWGLLFMVPFALINQGMADPYSDATNGSSTVAWIIALIILFANVGFLGTVTSQSVGKRIVGIRMLRVMELDDGTFDLVRVPLAIGLLRVPLHMLDTWLLFTGWFAPIWSKGHGTYADMICRTINFHDSRLPDPREERGGQAEWPGQAGKR